MVMCNSKKISHAQRVGIITHSFKCLGGIQTCIIELIAGLNEKGIVPEIVWDEPIDWRIVGDCRLQCGFAQRRLLVSSGSVRRWPPWLRRVVEPLRLRYSDFCLSSYDFVFSFEPGVRIRSGVRHLCFVIGPPYVRVPTTANLGAPNGCGRVAHQNLRERIRPVLRPERNQSYYTLSQWISDLFFEAHGMRLPVIWPPARSRALPLVEGHERRAGVLFLSRLTAAKRPEVMLRIAREFPSLDVTLAGASPDPELRYLEDLREKARRRDLSLVRFLANPSETEVARLLSQNELFVFPAPWEHFGIVTVEAILGGLIPLVHNSGGQREIVPHPFLRFNDEPELLEKLRGLLAFSAARKAELSMELMAHVKRSSPSHYRKELLRHLDADCSGAT
ncbi:MAG: glycosyltransferase family 4 protein [Verrucomicrobiia bacterium]